MSEERKPTDIERFKDSLREFLNSYSSCCPKCEFQFCDTDKTAEVLSELFNEPDCEVSDA